MLRLISSQTVEELVLARAQQKLAIDGKVIQAGKFDDVTTGAEYEALLAKAFETGTGEDDAEEQNELDDDELNELLARGDHELEIFAQMDKDREAKKLAAWTEAGHKTPLQPSLMAETELPAFYRRDIGDELAAKAQKEEDSLEGRGRRAKAGVQYTDGLTDDQWLNAVDASDDDVEEAADRKRKRKDKMVERKRLNEQLELAEAEGRPLNTIKLTLKDDADPTASPATGTPARGSNKKRPRPSKSATPSVLGEDGPLKKRKVDAEGPPPAEISAMWKLYNETNALKSEAGEQLNVYFLTPVSKKDFFDYYDIIKRPMTMNQIKKRIGKDPTFDLNTFKNDMHQVWDNARTYNVEGSWVYNAAEDQQEFFDKLYEEELAKLQSSQIQLPGGAGSGMTSGNASGTSTPMYKPQEKLQPVPTKIKLNMGKGAKQRIQEIEMEDENKSEDSASEDDDDY